MKRFYFFSDCGRLGLYDTVDHFAIWTTSHLGGTCKRPLPTAKACGVTVTIEGIRLAFNVGRRLYTLSADMTKRGRKLFEYMDTAPSVLFLGKRTKLDVSWSRRVEDRRRGCHRLCKTPKKSCRFGCIALIRLFCHRRIHFGSRIAARQGGRPERDQPAGWRPECQI